MLPMRRERERAIYCIGSPSPLQMCQEMFQTMQKECEIWLLGEKEILGSLVSSGRKPLKKNPVCVCAPGALGHCGRLYVS